MADEIHQEFDDIWRLHRRRALDVAYRMLGSLTEAEDIVQEAFSRLLGQNIDEIDDPERWLVTVTSRLCLDHLRSARIQRESYVGPWRPEPLVQYEGASSDPADRVTLDDTIRMALMIVLDRLTPAERASFILHDVFKIPFEEVGQILGRSTAACRQLASRARRRLGGEVPTIGSRESPRHPRPTDDHRMVVEGFVAACNQGDTPKLAWLEGSGGIVRLSRWFGAGIDHGRRRQPNETVASGWEEGRLPGGRPDDLVRRWRPI